MQKEMGANVTTYVMFITFASLIAAPFMYGLSHQLVSITQGLMGGLGVGASSQTSGLSIGGGGIKESDFVIFA